MNSTFAVLWSSRLWMRPGLCSGTIKVFLYQYILYSSPVSYVYLGTTIYLSLRANWKVFSLKKGGGTIIKG